MRAVASLLLLFVFALAGRRGRPDGDPARPGRSTCSTARASTRSTRGWWTRTARTRCACSPSSTRWTARRPSASAASSGAASITRESYRDYRLIVEFRWGLLTWGAAQERARATAACSSTRRAPTATPGRDFNGPWMRSIEAQIIEGGVGDIILVAGFEADGTRLTPRITAAGGQGPGRRSRLRPATASPASSRAAASTGTGGTSTGRTGSASAARTMSRAPTASGRASRWSREGDRLTNIVNGKVVNEGVRSSLTEGRILIQSRGRGDLLPAHRPRAAGT